MFRYFLSLMDVFRLALAVSLILGTSLPEVYAIQCVEGIVAGQSIRSLTIIFLGTINYTKIQFSLIKARV